MLRGYVYSLAETETDAMADASDGKPDGVAQAQVRLGVAIIERLEALVEAVDRLARAAVAPRGL